MSFTEVLAKAILAAAAIIATTAGLALAVLTVRAFYNGVVRAYQNGDAWDLAGLALVSAVVLFILAVLIDGVGK